VPAISRKIIEWSSSRIRRRAFGVGVTRWYSAPVPNGAATLTASIAAATVARPPGAPITGARPAASEK
jgi:hypothetical protein